MIEHIIIFSILIIILVAGLYLRDWVKNIQHRVENNAGNISDILLADMSLAEEFTKLNSDYDYKKKRTEELLKKSWMAPRTAGENYEQHENQKHQT